MTQFLSFFIKFHEMAWGWVTTTRSFRLPTSRKLVCVLWLIRIKTTVQIMVMSHDSLIFWWLTAISHHGYRKLDTSLCENNEQKVDFRKRASHAMHQTSQVLYNHHEQKLMKQTYYAFMPKKTHFDSTCNSPKP